MFATLLGGLPRPLDNDGTPIANHEAAVIAALEAQIEAGLGPLTDGRLAASWGEFGTTGHEDRPGSVEGWRFASDHAGDAVVKQALPGPYTLGRRLDGGHRDAATPAATTRAAVSALRSEIVALRDAGCLFVEIEELEANRIGLDPAERRIFADAHVALLDGIDGIHCSLSIVGGNADGAGIETILAAPYRSLAVDLIAGPDNWRLVRATPGDRGIVCGALDPMPGGDDGPEVQVWAAAYAGSSNGRGRDRVGLGTAGGLAALDWPAAVEKMRRLGRASALAAGSPDELMRQLDPRAIDIRSAALGRYDPPEQRPARRPRRP